MKTLLLQMMEWHAKTIHGKDYYDVWHAGRFLDEWVDQETLKEIKNTFGHYEKADSFRALKAIDKIDKNLLSVVGSIGNALLCVKKILGTRCGEGR